MKQLEILEAIINDLQTCLDNAIDALDSIDITDDAGTSISNIGHGLLWKPRSDTTDSRLGKPALLITDEYYKSFAGDTVAILGKDFNYLGDLVYKPSSEPGVNNDAKHYFAGWPGGINMGPRQLYRKSGGSIYLNMNNTYIGPFDPRERLGGI